MWIGPHVVPMDAYRRLMSSRDWCAVSAWKVFAGGFVCGEFFVVAAYLLGRGWT